MAMCLNPGFRGDLRLRCRNCAACIAERRNEVVQKSVAEMLGAACVMFVTLTYRREPDRDRLRMDREAYRKQVRRLSPSGVDLRSVAVVEFGKKGGRVHHHEILCFDHPAPLGNRQIKAAWSGNHRGFAHVQLVKGSNLSRRNSLASAVRDRTNRRLEALGIPTIPEGERGMLKSARYLSKYLIKDASGDLDGIRVVPSKHWGQIGLERFIAGVPMVGAVLKHFPDARVTRVRVPNSPIALEGDPLHGLTWRQDGSDWVVFEDGSETQRFAEFDEFWSWWSDYGPVDAEGLPRPHHGSLLFRPWRDWNSSDRSVRALTVPETSDFSAVMAECSGPSELVEQVGSWTDRDGAPLPIGSGTDVSRFLGGVRRTLPPSIEVAYDDGSFTDQFGETVGYDLFSVQLARRSHAPRSTYANRLKDRTTWAGEFIGSRRDDPSPEDYARFWGLLSAGPVTPGATASALRLGNTLVHRIASALLDGGYIASDASGRLCPVTAFWPVVRPVPRLVQVDGVLPAPAAPASRALALDPAYPPGIPAAPYLGAYSTGRPDYQVHQFSLNAWRKMLRVLDEDQIARGGGPSPDPDPGIAAEKAHAQRVSAELKAKNKAAPRRTIPGPPNEVPHISLGAPGVERPGDGSRMPLPPDDGSGYYTEDAFKARVAALRAVLKHNP